MKTEKPPFNFRYEELPTIGEFILNSFNQNIADFAQFTFFNSPFPANFATELAVIKNILRPVVSTRQLKAVSSRLYANVYSTGHKVDLLEVYVENAGNALTVGVEDFGIKQLRRAINRNDVEEVVFALGTVNELVADNMVALGAQGFTTGMQNALVALKDSIDADNVLQNSIINSRAVLVEDNKGVMGDFYKSYLNKVAKSGKLIYKKTSRAKFNEFNFSELKRRIRHDEAHTEVSGIVKNYELEPVNRAKLYFRPIDGGRTKTVYTDADGKYVVKGIRPDDYILVTSKGAMMNVQAVTIESRAHVVINIVITVPPVNFSAGVPATTTSIPHLLPPGTPNPTPDSHLEITVEGGEFDVWIAATDSQANLPVAGDLVIRVTPTSPWSGNLSELNFYYPGRTSLKIRNVSNTAGSYSMRLSF